MNAPNRPAIGRRVLLAVAAVYLVVLGIILLWPDHLDRNAGAAYAVLYTLFPGATSTTVDFGLNVILFLPFGAMLALTFRRRPWLLATVACVVPLLIEIFQGVFLPGRTSSILDVVANTLGGLLGAATTTVIRRVRVRRRRRARP